MTDDPRIEVVEAALRADGWLTGIPAGYIGLVAVKALDAYDYRPRSFDEFVHEYLHDARWHAIVETFKPFIEADLRERIAQEIEAEVWAYEQSDEKNDAYRNAARIARGQS